jgi:hypothetical protein
VKRERKVERYALDSGWPREDSTVNEQIVDRNVVLNWRSAVSVVHPSC